jgi:N-acetylmuramoyl-L-alanine amidase
MPRLRWSIKGLTSESGSGDGEGLIAQYRYGHNTGTTSRLVLDLKTPAEVLKAFRIPAEKNGAGHRIVLDLKAVSAKKFAASVKAVKADAKPLKRRSRKPLIVIDAGHGGKDPGAIGVSGQQEKVVTLTAAKELQQSLLKTGRYEVALTRGNDNFLELEERVNKAREYEVDLFISLHADAGRKSSTRGASVYTLSSSGERRAESLKKSNNWVIDIEKDERPQEVTDILVDLVKRETKNRSSEFAQLLIPHVQAQGWPILRNSHRNAGFYVLFAPDVPAVLFEMGFLTNPQDEALLSSQRQRKKLIKGVVRAIDAFFDGQELYVAQR